MTTSDSHRSNPALRFWLSLGEAVAMLTLAGALLAGGFALTVWWFPQAADVWELFRALDTLRLTLALVLVATPVWFILRHKLQKAKGAPARGWVAGGLAFVGLLAVSIAVVTALATWLGGELTARTLAKIAWAVLLGCGLLAYYGQEARSDTTMFFASRLNQFARVAVVVLAALFVGVAFLTIGPPTYWRDLRADEAREAAMREILWRVEAYAREHGALPQSLNEVWNQPFPLSFAGRVEVRDFSYRVISDREFEVCARFAQPSLLRRVCGDDPRCLAFADDQVTTHPQGEWCVRREVGEAPVALPAVR